MLRTELQGFNVPLAKTHVSSSPTKPPKTYTVEGGTVRQVRAQKV